MIALERKSSYNETLEKHLPPGSMPILKLLLPKTGLDIVLKKHHKNCLGKFTIRKMPFSQARITISQALPPPRFLIVLIHELAHYYTWKLYPKRKVAPHGEEWKNSFSMLLSAFVKKNVFPESIEKELIACIDSGFNSSKAMMHLNLALNRWKHKNDRKKMFAISDLEVSSTFLYKGSIYKIVKINNSRSVAEKQDAVSKKFSFYKAMLVEKVE